MTKTVLQKNRVKTLCATVMYTKIAVVGTVLLLHANSENS